MNMKKLLCTVLALTMIFAACSFAMAEDTGVVIELTRPSFFGDASEYVELKTQWMEMMKEKYGATVNVNYLPTSEYTTNINKMISSGSLTGLVGIYNTSQVLSYKEMGAIEPMTKYLENNETWNSLPVEMQEAYVIDGEIWALPMGDVSNMFTRTMRKDWLDNLGLEAPTTLDELYEVSYAFTYNDPDGNGVDDTYGITSSGTWNLQDIFAAFGAPLLNGGDTSIVFDQELGCWTDSMLKDSMVDCLTYLHKMYEEGILDPELFTKGGADMRETFWSNKAGSTFYWIGFSDQSVPYLTKIVEDVEFVEIPAITGTATEKLNPVWLSTVPYVLVAGTENAQEMVDAFVDLALGAQDSHFDFCYGIEGVTYRVDGDTLYYLIDPDTNNVMPKPSLCMAIPEYYDEWNFLNDGLSEEDTATALALLNFKKTMVKDGIADGVCYWLETLQSAPVSDTYNMISGDLQTAFGTAVSSAIIGTASVEDAIAEYIEEAKNLGAQDVLDEANAFMGLTSQLSY